MNECSEFIDEYLKCTKVCDQKNLDRRQCKFVLDKYNRCVFQKPEPKPTEPKKPFSDVYEFPPYVN